MLTATPPVAYKTTFNRLEAKTINVYVPEDSRYSFATASGWNLFPDFIGIKTIKNKEYTLDAGQSMQLEATIPAFTASTEWSTDNPDIATIDADGLLTAVSRGSASVSLTLTDAFGVKTIQEATVSVTGSSEIENIEYGYDSEDEYYSIDGIKMTISEKTPGLYIRIRDGKAQRILIR